MIPKIIHYFWFGGKPIPAKYQKYIQTWKKFCPDYEIIRWDESNYDCTKNEFLRAAYEAKKWAFVTDYARLDVVNQYGGVYLDTDVELIKPLDEMMDYQAFAGFECSGFVAFGLGFGSEANNVQLQEMLDVYSDISKFVDEEGNFKTDLTCPIVQTGILEKHGLVKNNQRQSVGGFEIFPEEYFCPMNYSFEYNNLTENTISIHHYAASWFSTKDRLKFHIINKLSRNYKMFKRLLVKNK